MPIEACLLDYVEGRLGAEAARAVEAFLAENADWAAQVALLREPVPGKPVPGDAAFSAALAVDVAAADGSAAAAPVADGLAAADVVADLTCPPELKARLLRPVEGRLSPGRQGWPVEPVWSVRALRSARRGRAVGLVRRRVYYAAAAVAVLLMASGLVWRMAGDRLGGRPEDGAVLSASVDAADAGRVLSAEAGLTGAVLSAEPIVASKVKPVVEPIVAQAVAEACKAEVPAAASVAPPRAFSEVRPLQGGRLPAERFEAGEPASALLARVPTAAAAGLMAEVSAPVTSGAAVSGSSAGFDGASEARRSRFEPDALIAQAYVALTRRIERQRIRREIKREVTSALQAASESQPQPAFWHIYN